MNLDLFLYLLLSFDWLLHFQSQPKNGINLMPEASVYMILGSDISHYCLVYPNVAYLDFCFDFFYYV
jgi:hypothetical protein